MFELAVLLLVNRIRDRKEIGLKHKSIIGDINSVTMNNGLYYIHYEEEFGKNRATRTIDNPWKLRKDIKRRLRAIPLLNAYGKLRTTSKIDLVAFVTFTTGFLVFNVIYYIKHFSFSIPTLEMRLIQKFNCNNISR